MKEYEDGEDGGAGGVTVPILKGFSMYLRKKVEVSREDLEVEVKKRVKDLVTYFVVPRLKLLDKPFDKKINKFLELEEDRETSLYLRREREALNSDE